MQTASEGIDAGTFLPAILLGRRSGARNVAERAAHHILDLDTGECLAFVESLCKQHRKGGLVELNPFPERPAAEPLVLLPVAVLDLGGVQVSRASCSAPIANRAPAVSTRSSGHTR